MRNKQVKIPSSTHALLLELRADLHEKGHSAYWQQSNGTLCHGGIGAAPLHVLIEVCATAYYQAMDPARAADSEAVDEARQKYLEGLQDDQNF